MKKIVLLHKPKSSELGLNQKLEAAIRIFRNDGFYHAVKPETYTSFIKTQVLRPRFLVQTRRIAQAIQETETDAR